MRILAFMLLFPAIAFAGDGLPDQPFISAKATASLKVKPDGVRITVNARGHGDSATKAFEMSLNRAERLIEAVRSAGIPDGRIVASDVSVQEETRYRDGEFENLGHVANRGMTIEVREMERVGQLLDALLKADVSEIADIERFIDDEEKVRADVQKLAFEKARARAQRFAAMDNRKLGELWWVGDELDMVRQRELAFAAVGASIAPYFNAGEMEFRQAVEVIYLLD